MMAEISLSTNHAPTFADHNGTTLLAERFTNKDFSYEAEEYFTDAPEFPGMDNVTSTHGPDFTDAAFMNEDSRNSAMLSAIRKWWTLIVIPVGIVGNILTLLVFLRRQNRAISVCVYLAALAACDTAVLLATGLNVATRGLVSRLSEKALSTFCKVAIYLVLSSAQSGVMIILAMLTERVVAVLKPLQARMWLSPKRAVIVSVVLIMFSLLYNGPLLLTAGGATRAGNVSCQGYTFSNTLTAIYSTVTLVVQVVIPFLAILIMNAIILYAVKTSRLTTRTETDGKSFGTSSSTVVMDDISDIPDTPQARPEPRRTPSPKPKRSDMPAAAGSSRQGQNGLVKKRKITYQERQLTVMAAIMTLVFVLLTMPRYLYSAVVVITSNSQTNGNSNGRFNGHASFDWHLASVVFQRLYTTNSACNFFLYVLSGSKFRRDLRQMVCCRPQD